MKLLHLSDLHLGKRVYEYSMIPDQRYILNEILTIARSEKPDAVLIAGDVYDKSVPSAEAVQLLDEFLFGLSALCGHIFIISGNHDSPERIAFGARLMDKSGIHLSPVYDGKITPTVLYDEHGAVNIYMLPFIKPANVRAAFPDEEISGYTEAVAAAIAHMNVDENERNVLISHQFVTGSVRSESEEISVGGTDNVDALCYDSFDYVALGHIHSPQHCSRESLRYCGTPLKYSFSEAGDEKSVTVVELGEKGDVRVRTVPLTPLHELRELRGSYDELMARSFYDGTALTEDYVRITLTDEEDVFDAVGRLRTVYKGLMSLRYDNARTRTSAVVDAAEDTPEKSPEELFAELYRTQNNREMSDEQRDYMEKVFESATEGLQ